MIKTLIKALGVAVGLLTPVDEANVDTANRLGLETFVEIVDGELVELECAETPLELQHPHCRERMRWALLTISNRESAGNWSPRRTWTGIHSGDSHHEPRVRYWAGRFGRVSWWCPFHWGSTGFSTVGPHGLMYGYNVQLLGRTGNCVPTRAFGVATVSAEAAGRRYLKSCKRRRAEGRGWCPTTRAITRTRRRARRLHYQAETPLETTRPHEQI